MTRNDIISKNIYNSYIPKQCFNTMTDFAKNEGMGKKGKGNVCKSAVTVQMLLIKLNIGLFKKLKQQDTLLVWPNSKQILSQSKALLLIEHCPQNKIIPVGVGVPIHHICIVALPLVLHLILIELLVSRSFRHDYPVADVVLFWNFVMEVVRQVVHSSVIGKENLKLSKQER